MDLVAFRVSRVRILHPRKQLGGPFNHTRRQLHKQAQRVLTRRTQPTQPMLVDKIALIDNQVTRIHFGTIQAIIHAQHRLPYHYITTRWSATPLLLPTTISDPLRRHRHHLHTVSYTPTLHPEPLHPLHSQ